MRVLVTWSSKRGGTEEIGRTARYVLETRGFDAVAVPVDEVRRLDTFDAVIVGSALSCIQQRTDGHCKERAC
jgi:menaquinone-dependent protoporphyrinogen oxidase